MAPLPLTIGYEIPPEVAERLLACPPKRWKRPAMPQRVKLQVVINQAGKCKASGLPLGDIKNVEFDHRPALKARRFDPAANDTLPAANDPRFIEAILKIEHRKRTKRDEKDDAKAERLEKKLLPRLRPEDAEKQIAISKSFADHENLPEAIAKDQTQRVTVAYALLPKQPKKQSKYRWGNRPLQSRNSFDRRK